MNNSGNFILKVHIQDNNLKEVFLNKDKRCFTFIDDECVADLILPEFKLTSLKMLVKNVVNEEKNDDYYAEYDNDGLNVCEYDKEKINLLVEMVTNITIKDFLEYIDRVKQNDFYIDNVVDIYNATIPEEVKRLVSYTTNGFKFNESDIRMLAHEEILDSEFIKDKFIPIFNCDNTYFGYDLNERRYAKYVDGSIYKFYDKLDELLSLDEKEEEQEVETTEEVVEVIDTNEKEQDDEESLFTIITEETEEKKVEEEQEELEIIGEEEPEPKEKKEKKKKIEEKEEHQDEVDEKYNETIKNINDQFDKLNTQVESEAPKKNPYAINVDELFSNYKTEIQNAKKNKYRIDIDKIYKEAQLEAARKKRENPYEMDIASLFSNYKTEIIKKPAKKQEKQENKVDTTLKENPYKINMEEIFSNYKMELVTKPNKKEDKKEEKREEKKEEKIEKTKEENPYKMDIESIFSNYKTDFVNKELAKRELTPKTINSSEIKHGNYTLANTDLLKDESSRYELVKEKIEAKEEEKPKEDKQEFVVSKDITDNIRESVKKSLKKIEKEELAEIDLERLIDNSLTDSINNYRINYNDSMKLVVEHIPYYQNDNSFGVVQIPELEVEKHTLLPGISLDFDRIKFKVLSLSDDKVELLIDKATNISNENGDKIKKGDIVKMNSSTELIYLLDKKDARESWTFRMEKAVYEKELRRIEYSKILNLLKAKTNYDALANVEKIETQKSIMLFLNFIVKNNEINKLEELYEVIKNGDNYAKFVTEYNNNQAHEDKDSLPSYDHKKDFLEKLKYVNTIISTDAITYPRYIYASFNYFDGEQLLEDYLEEINNSVRENDFGNYLKGLFKQNGVFTSLDEVGKDNLNKCLEYLSALYKHHPNIGEEDKYKIENTLIITSEDEDLALLISKLCRKGIKDYNSFKEYDSLMKEEYRTGNLKYPLYSDDFDIEEVRKGGEYDEL